LWQRRSATPWLLPALVLLALSLAALPFTGGGAAKSALSAFLGEQLFGVLLLSGVAGVALMGRFLWLLKGRPLSAQQDSVTLLGWLLLLPVAVWTPFLWEAMAFEWKALLPLTSGIALFILGLLLQRWVDSLSFPIRLKGERFILGATQIHSGLPDVSNLLRPPWELLKQAVQPLQAVSRSQPNPALGNPAVWWLLLMLALLGTLI
ncbi:MAG: hypothetical protein ABW098_19915, partial [Candidatus Thiodiazotropha sp.]